MMKYDVFISYSRQDFREVEALRQNMQEAVRGLNVWFDITGIESGEEFSDKIVSAIERSEIVVFMISDGSMSSPWTKKEIMYAKNIGKKVVPVLLRGARLSGWFLFEMGNVDCIACDDEKQWNKFIDNLSTWFGKEVNTSAEKVEPLPLPSRRFNILYDVYVGAVLLGASVVFLAADFPNTRMICATAIALCIMSVCGNWLQWDKKHGGLLPNILLTALFLLATLVAARLSILPYTLLCTMALAPLALQWHRLHVRWKTFWRSSLRNECRWKFAAVAAVCLWLSYGCIVLPAVCSIKGFRGIPFFNRFAAEYVLAKAGFPFAQFRVGLTYERGVYYVQQDMETARHWYKLAAKNGNEEARQKSLCY